MDVRVTVRDLGDKWCAVALFFFAYCCLELIQSFFVSTVLHLSHHQFYTVE